jgi:hypothetical protein
MGEQCHTRVFFPSAEAVKVPSERDFQVVLGVAIKLVIPTPQLEIELQFLA